MKISDLVNKVEPFRFDFDGEVVEGTYFKYKTTTPNYAKEVAASVPEELKQGTDEEKLARENERYEAIAKAGLKAIADTIISWNVEDDQGLPVVPNIELFEQMPRPFTDKFLDFFAELRKGNPMPPVSLNT